MVIVDPFKCHLFLGHGRAEVFHNGKKLQNITFVIPRMGPAVLEYGIKIIQHFELQGVPVLNTAEAISRSVNKFYCLQTIARNSDVQVPASVFIRKSDQMKEALHTLGGPPVLMKVLSANYKLGAMLIENITSASSFLDINLAMGGMGEIGQSIMLERYHREADGKAYNLLMLQDELLGAFYHVKRFDFKQAAKQSTSADKGFIEPSKEYISIAQKTLNALGLDFALVSMIDTDEGPKVFEVSVMPEIEIFEANKELDIPNTILAYPENKIPVGVPKNEKFF